MIVHLLGGGSNHVTSFAKRNESGEYPISFFSSFYLFGYLFSNIGDNVQLKCKGGKFGKINDTLEDTTTLDFYLFDGRCVIKLKETLVRVILAPI